MPSESYSLSRIKLGVDLGKSPFWCAIVLVDIETSIVIYIFLISNFNNHGLRDERAMRLTAATATAAAEILA